MAYVVRGKSGKVVGRYATRGEAEARIAQLRAGAARLAPFKFGRRSGSPRATSFHQWLADRGITKDPNEPSRAGMYHYRRASIWISGPSGGTTWATVRFRSQEKDLDARSLEGALEAAKEWIDAAPELRGSLRSPSTPRVEFGELLNAWHRSWGDTRKSFSRQILAALRAHPELRKQIDTDTLERAERYAKQDYQGSPRVPEGWIEEIRNMLDKAGYAGDLQKHAERLVREGYGPEEIAHRIKTGQIEHNLGIQMVKRGYFKMSPTRTAGRTPPVGPSTARRVGFALEEGRGGLLAVRLDDPKFPGNGGIVVAHPKSAAEFEKLIERRDGARDPNMRLWRGNAPMGARVSLDGGPTLSSKSPRRARSALGNILKDARYDQHHGFRGWNIEPTVLQEPRLFPRVFPELTRADHARLATLFDTRANTVRTQHHKWVARGEETHGTNGPAISGGFHEDWPESVKETIRRLAHGYTKLRDAAVAHLKASRLRGIQ